MPGSERDRPRFVRSAGRLAPGLPGIWVSALATAMVLGGALLIALTLSPVLGYYFLPKRVREREGLVVRAMNRVYAWFLAGWINKQPKQWGNPRHGYRCVKAP